MFDQTPPQLPAPLATGHHPNDCLRAPIAMNVLSDQPCATDADWAPSRVTRWMPLPTTRGDMSQMQALGGSQSAESGACLVIVAVPQRSFT